MFRRLLGVSSMSEHSSSMEWRLEAFESRPSLWRLIEEFVPESERFEIKEALGEDLVDETLDLQNEASTLLEIWKDYREETAREEKEQALQRHLSRLPEPPMIRENLKKEIKMFVEMLQQQAKEEGRNTTSILSKEESNIVEYVYENRGEARPSSSSSRPPTSHSRDGRQTPMRATPSSNGSRCTSSLSDHLDSMNDTLNALEIDRITDHLRQLLTEEKEGLLGDIAFLQDCLMEESDYRRIVTSSPDPEPSLRDLRELGTKLEKELLHTDTPVVRQTSRNLSHSKRQFSLEVKPSFHNRQVSGSEPHILPRPPSTPHDHHLHGLVPNRTFTSKNANVRSVSQGQFSPLPSSSAGQSRMIPSPPSSGKSGRPSSAARFRKMVVECRDSGC